MRLSSTIGLAFEAITRNKLRSALTSLGVIMGVAAVIVMMALGDGAKASIEQRVASLGTNVLTVSAGSANIGGVRIGQGAVTTLTPADASAIAADVPGAHAVSPGVGSRTQIVGPSGNWQTQVQGVGSAYADIRAWDLASGSFFTEDDVEKASRVVVLGAMVRDQVFGEGANPVGQIVRINNQPFRVMGVLDRRGQSAMGQDQDDTVIAPYTAVQKRLLGTTNLSNILVAAQPGVSTATLSTSVADLLRRRHRIGLGEADDFNVRSPEEMARVLSSTTDTMAYLLASVAAISLVVGGIGIMNIMLVSVTERIREIGLRMAVGAGPRDVRRQFLAEAMLISMIGGVIGIAIGIIGALLVGKFSDLPVEVNANVVGLAATFSIATGLFFGYYPARKASLLDPIEALRQQ